MRIEILEDSGALHQKNKKTEIKSNFVRFYCDHMSALQYLECTKKTDRTVSNSICIFSSCAFKLRLTNAFKEQYNQNIIQTNEKRQNIQKNLNWTVCIVQLPNRYHKDS